MLTLPTFAFPSLSCLDDINTLQGRRQYNTASYLYHGHEHSAKLCARFAFHLFACPDEATTAIRQGWRCFKAKLGVVPLPKRRSRWWPNPKGQLCHFFTTAPTCGARTQSPPPAPPSTTPTPQLDHFNAYALHRTWLHSSVTFATLYRLQRLKARFLAAKGSSGHRLFISALMLASKITNALMPVSLLLRGLLATTYLFQCLCWLPRLSVTTLILTSRGVLLVRVCLRFGRSTRWSGRCAPT